MAEFPGDTTAEHAFALEALLRPHIEREELLLIPLIETAVDATATRGRSQ